MPDGSPVPTLELMFNTYVRAHSLKPTASFTFENSNGWKMKFPFGAIWVYFQGLLLLVSGMVFIFVLLVVSQE